jgi:hypothetical protein
MELDNVPGVTSEAVVDALSAAISGAAANKITNSCQLFILVGTVCYTMGCFA